MKMLRVSYATRKFEGGAYDSAVNVNARAASWLCGFLQDEIITRTLGYRVARRSAKRSSFLSTRESEIARLSRRLKGLTSFSLGKRNS